MINTTMATLFTGILITIGDSTVEDRSYRNNGQQGWGVYVADTNLAVGGTSTRSFYNNHWDPSVLASGDTLLIQFGHNDSNSDPAVHTTLPEYESFLSAFVTESRAVGANPMLVTPPAAWIEFPLEHRVKSTRQVAIDLEVPLIDLYQFSLDLYTQADDVSELMGGDGIHPSEEGAQLWASFVQSQITSVPEASSFLAVACCLTVTLTTTWFRRKRGRSAIPSQ